MAFAIVIVMLMGFIVGILYFFLLFDKPFLSYPDLPFIAQQKTVEAGETMPLLVRRCNSSASVRTYLTTHTLEDVERHKYWLLPSVKVFILPGCTTSTSFLNQIPIDAPAGTYRLIGIAEVRGVFRNHFVDWYSVPFTVTEHQKKAPI